MQLTDFFAPLNISNFLIFAFVIITFDAIGANISYFLKPPEYLRPVFWLCGLGVFIFLWFILHFFIPFWPLYVWVTVAIFFFVSLPIYIKQKGLLTYIRSLLSFPFPAIFILLALKPLFFLLSAPPYIWDEMAYHFYSPAKLVAEIVWPFAPNSVSYGPSMYDLMPHTLDVSFRLMFSLSKTYATARLLHFFLFFSSIYAIALFLREKMGKIAATVYSFLAFYLTLSILTFSTLGYVDVAAAVIANLFAVVFYDFLTIKRKNLFYLSLITFGLAISIKYTVLTFLGSVISIGFIAAIFFHREKIISTIKNAVKKTYLLKFVKTVFNAILIAIFFGGFWYINNYIVTGNPLFPLVFKCHSNPTCGVPAGGYFTGWTIPLRAANIPEISKLIFQETSVLVITVVALILSIFISFKSKKPILSRLPILILIAIILEFALSAKFVGFELRYFYHWSLLIPFVISLPLVFNVKSLPFENLIPTVYLFLVIVFTGNLLTNNIKSMYSGDFVQGYVRNYAMRRINLNQWLDFYFPQMDEVIKWCGEKRQVKEDMLAADPALIWYSYEGLMRVFIVNCNILWQSPPSGMSINDYANLLAQKYPKAYITSSVKCDQGASLPSNADETVKRHYQLNQQLICGRQEVMKNLYKF